MRRGWAVWVWLTALGVTSPAWADDNADCQQITEPNRAILGCSHIISGSRGNREKLGDAYLYRGIAYENEGDYDRGIADESKAIELSPRQAEAYFRRGNVYFAKTDFDRAITDYDMTIALDPKFTLAYGNRGNAYGNKGDFDRQIADESKAIELSPQYANAYFNRGKAYLFKKDDDRAIADFNVAIELDPKLALAYADRGNAYGEKGDYDRAIDDESTAIELKGDYGLAYFARGEAHRAKGDAAKALADFRVAARLLPADGEVRGQLLARIAEIETQVASAAPAAPGSAPASQVAAASLGTRVALVIGNSEYAAVGKLTNPQRDAEAIAAALRGDGFEVTIADNLSRADFVAAINQFSDTAEKADWAVVYFAGHGLQLDGVNYLVPVDAKLVADRDVQNEAIPLYQVVSAMSGVRKLGLIVVDACRNNPFLDNMRFTGAARASLTRGLARVKAKGTTLVEFSASDGQEALDGDTAGNSPFAAALAKWLATPGLDVGMMLRQVHADVLAATDDQQEPISYGNLPRDFIYFRPTQ
jgi:tetratricopeptide (TPR) repeat protein